VSVKVRTSSTYSVTNVILSYRLKKLKEEKVKLDIEMDSLKAQMENKERAIRKLEEDLSAP